VFEAHTEWARVHADALLPKHLCFANPPAPARILRVGYVSPNFNDHAAAYFFASTLECHDPARVHVVCYSDTVRTDQYTDRIRSASAEWRDTGTLSHAELAELIRDDRIDILVDLSGHTEGNRLLAFARKPAPLQVTWNGYANTTGLATMDYRITDAMADPPGLTEHLHTERLLRMPEVYMAFEPPEMAPEVNPLPALDHGHVTFGSFNAVTKLTPAVVRTWSRILQCMPDARLLVATMPSEPSRLRILAMFAQHGIDAHRIDVHGRLPRADFLALHNKADIALDPFPFHGTTTTCHSLWMGLPVVTLAGASHVSRVGVSLLSCVGMPQLVASTEDEYVEIAVRLAQDRDALRQIRLTLRQRMAASPLTDARRFAGNLETAFRGIWTEWCLRQTP
jgi:predicted O-linked N-acetylglucosamine transferase (SPINDLY family)